MKDLIQSNYDLSALNTLGVPSRAEFFAECDDKKSFINALAWARDKSLPVSLLGGGSNALLPELISGLVIKPSFKGIQLSSENDGTVIVKVGAGETWHEFVLWVAQNGYSGIENLALIPGSVGAAPIQNIGAYGVEVASAIKRVECVDMQTGETHFLNNEECGFAYRHSVFKTDEYRHLCICAVEFKLSKSFHATLSYAALAAQFPNEKPKSAMEVVMKVEKIRREKLPDPAYIPNSGSFFKNPMIDNRAFSDLKERYPNIVSYDVDQHSKKLAAAWLIDQGGWKQKPLNGVRVHSEQALVITNENRLSLDAVMHLARAIKTDVQDRFGVDLEIEPQPLAQIKLN